LKGRVAGTLRTGLEADLIVVGEDPLQNLATLKSPLLVINDGSVAVNRLASRHAPR